MKNIIKAQFFILLVGTIFAWTNFTIELVEWLNNQACTLGCSAGNGLVNPFVTPCFYGAIFFLISFVLSLLLFLDSKKGAK